MGEIKSGSGLSTEEIVKIMNDETPMETVSLDFARNVSTLLLTERRLESAKATNNQTNRTL